MPDRPTFLAAGLLPLRRYAEFRGRSTRTELIAFFCLWLLAGVALSLGTVFLLSYRPAIVAMGLSQLALICPGAALAVRRLHDTGRSGWWSLLAVPGLTQGLWRDLHAEPGLVPAMPSPVELAVSLASLAILVLLLWNDDPEANRYGPNPRYDPPSPADAGAQGLA